MSRAAESVPDYQGRPLAEGARVIGWLDGIRYTGTLRQIDPPHAGCGGHRHVTVIRDDDLTAHRTFSDALTQP